MLIDVKKCNNAPLINKDTRKKPNNEGTWKKIEKQNNDRHVNESAKLNYANFRCSFAFVMLSRWSYHDDDNNNNNKYDPKTWPIRDHICNE